jgi:uncharacterized protein
LIIVSDTSVLISFKAIGKLHILKGIFSNIVIPEGVYNELNAEQKEFVLEDWMAVQKISNFALYRSLYLKLHKGESEAITLAIEKQADFILLDDKEARKEAGGWGLKVIGTVGLLLLAKKEGLISSVMAEIDKLEQLINFRLSLDLKEQIRELSIE